MMAGVTDDGGGGRWAADMVRSAGLRATVGRCCVLQALADGGHRPVDEIVARVATRATVPRETIVRAVADLTRADLLLALSVPGGSVFSLRDRHWAADLHLHCRGCGQVSDVRVNGFAELAQQLWRGHGFTADPAATVISGQCRQCAT